MTPLLRPIQTLTTTFHIILCYQISLALALPASNDLRARDIDVRAIAAPDLSGAAGKIAGGAFALILLSLAFGLGAASIAILGSTEWREFRDRKKPKVPPKDGTTAQQEDEEKGVDRAETGLTASTVDEKEKPSVEPARRQRLTLKSFMPVDFSDLRPGWLTGTNKT